MAMTLALMFERNDSQHGFKIKRIWQSMLGKRFLFLELSILMLIQIKSFVASIHLYLGLSGYTSPSGAKIC
jgi:hypothetical protein